MDFYCAISRLEQAMWDITGKKVGVHISIARRGLPEQDKGLRQRTVRRSLDTGSDSRKGVSNHRDRFHCPQVRPDPRSLA